MITAEMKGLSVAAIEIDPLYVDVSIMRWQEFTGQQAVLEGGTTFEEVRDGEARTETTTH